VRCDTCHAEHLVAYSWPLLRIPAPAALVIPFTSQAPRFLRKLRGAADGRRVMDARGRAMQEQLPKARPCG
jgi:hypothetical protein